MKMMPSSDGAPQRLAFDGVAIDQLCRLFLLEDAQRFRNGHALLRAPLRKDAAEHLADVAALIHPAADHADRQARGLFDFDLDQPDVVEAALDLAARLIAHALRVGGERGARTRRLLLRVVAAEDRAERRSERTTSRRASRRPRLGVQHVDYAFYRVMCRHVANLVAPFVGDRANCRLHQIADHRFDVAPDVADLRILRCLDLYERRADECGETARDLGLADAGRSDHEDVLRRDLFAQIFPRARPAIAIAQRDRNRSLCLPLADDVLVELGDDLARRQRRGIECRRKHARHGSVSTVMSEFV